MTESWETHMLSEVCEIRPAKRESKERLNVTDTVSFVPMEDLPIDEKYLAPTQTRHLRKVYSGYTYFAEGDVLLAKITPCFQNGKLAIANDLTNGIGFGSSEFVVFRPSQELDNQYLYYFLSRTTFRDEGVARMSGAVGHQRVPKEFIEEYLIPLPPLAEQKRIVAILNEVFSAIAKAKAVAEKNLANARELFESHLANVDDEKHPLGKFVEIKTGKINANAAVKGGQYPFFTCSRDRFAIDSCAFDCDAVLLAGNNASGDFNVKHYIGKFNAYQRTYVITVKDKARLLSRFLYFQLLNSLRELKKSSVGANTRFLKLGMIQELNICVPSVAKQTHLLTIIEELQAYSDRLETIYAQKLANLDELKQSLLQKAFTGQLTAKAVELEMAV